MKFKFNVGEKKIIPVSQTEIGAIMGRALRKGKFCAVEWQRVDSGENDRMICAPIPHKVAATFTGKRASSPDVIPFMSSDRKAIRSLRKDSLRVLMADGQVYVVTRP